MKPPENRLAMPADAALPVPASLAALLSARAPLFTVPSFRTFTALAASTEP
jgi:hypothetical protein